jgi:CRISPR type I-E-associated protein CasB/Cse2
MTDDVEDGRWLNAASKAVDLAIRKMQAAEQKGSSEYRGFISRARRLCGRMPDKDPNATVDILQVLSRNGMLLYDTGSHDGLTPYERAAVITIALYSGGTRNSQCDNITLGSAIGKFIASDEHNDVEGTFKSLMKADDELESIVYDIGKIVRRLPENSIDYAMICNDLCALQNEDRFSSVKIRWAKDVDQSMYYNNKEKQEQGDK